MFYIDTSVLVAAFTAERSTRVAQDWLTAQMPGTLMVSDWTITEFSSALSMKLRTGHLQPTVRNSIMAAFQRSLEQSFDICPISTTHFRMAARFCDRFELDLRSGDALHLAVAIERGARIVTFDR